MSTDEAQSLARIHIDLFIELVPAGRNDGSAVVQNKSQLF